jgi:hypothetical protein
MYKNIAHPCNDVFPEEWYVIDEVEKGETPLWRGAELSEGGSATGGSPL